MFTVSFFICLAHQMAALLPSKYPLIDNGHGIYCSDANRILSFEKKKQALVTINYTTQSSVNTE